MTTKKLDWLDEREVALACEPLSPQEASAYEASKQFYQQYGRWGVWIYQRASRHLGPAILRRLPNRSEDIFASGRAAKSPVKGLKTLYLTRLLRKMRPRLMVEFGSGGSTAVAAALLAENERRYGVRGRLISFEQAPDFYDSIKNGMPERLKPYVEMRLCPVRYERIGGYRSISYETTYDFGTPDLLFIDGPAPVRSNGPPNHPIFSGDLIRMLDAGVSPSLAVTDVRWFNYKFYSDVLARTHQVSTDVYNRSVIVRPKQENTQVRS